MRTEDIVAGIIKGLYWTAGAIFAGEVTLMAIHLSGGLR